MTAALVSRFSRYGATTRRSTLQVIRSVFLLAVLSFSAYASEPGLRHSMIMRGQVLEVAPDGIIVCKGDSDGAQIGQVLDVIRHVRVRGGSPKQAGTRFRRENVGQVKVQALSPEVNDMVELERK